MVTSNKRELVYDSNGNFIDTKAILMKVNSDDKDNENVSDNEQVNDSETKSKNVRATSIFRSELAKRQYSTLTRFYSPAFARQASTKSSSKVRSNLLSYTTKSYEDSKVLKPILDQKLLAPILYNESVKFNLKNLEQILSIIPENNKVKQYLNAELEKKIQVCGNIRQDLINKYLKAVREIEI